MLLRRPKHPFYALSSNSPQRVIKHSSEHTRQSIWNRVSFVLSQDKQPQVCYEPSKKPALNLQLANIEHLVLGRFWLIILKFPPITVMLWAFFLFIAFIYSYQAINKNYDFSSSGFLGIFFNKINRRAQDLTRSFAQNLSSPRLKFNDRAQELLTPTPKIQIPSAPSIYRLRLGFEYSDAQHQMTRIGSTPMIDGLQFLSMRIVKSIDKDYFCCSLFLTPK